MCISIGVAFCGKEFRYRLFFIFTIYKCKKDKFISEYLMILTVKLLFLTRNVLYKISFKIFVVFLIISSFLYTLAICILCKILFFNISITYILGNISYFINYISITYILTNWVEDTKYSEE